MDYPRNSPWGIVQRAAVRNFTLLGLKIAIVALAVFIIVVAIRSDNKWALGGLFAYEVLP